MPRTGRGCVASSTRGCLRAGRLRDPPSVRRPQTGHAVFHTIARSSRWRWELSPLVSAGTRLHPARTRRNIQDVATGPVWSCWCPYRNDEPFLATATHTMRRLHDHRATACKLSGRHASLTRWNLQAENHVRRVRLSHLPFDPVRLPQFDLLASVPLFVMLWLTRKIVVGVIRARAELPTHDQRRLLASSRNAFLFLLLVGLVLIWVPPLRTFAFFPWGQRAPERARRCRRCRPRPGRCSDRRRARRRRRRRQASKGRVQPHPADGVARAARHRFDRHADQGVGGRDRGAALVAVVPTDVGTDQCCGALRSNASAEGVKRSGSDDAGPAYGSDSPIGEQNNMYFPATEALMDMQLVTRPQVERQLVGDKTLAGAKIAG